ncbi:hypothetical protein H1Q59_02830 [Holosporaceae bacterium 'Namur']|nr:hypothetical protein [Holosporaceae bacterium 'Namur']
MPIFNKGEFLKLLSKGEENLIENLKIDLEKYETISLAKNDGFSNEYLNAMLIALKGNNSIREIDLTEIGEVTEEGGMALAEFLTKNILNRLNLRGNNIHQGVIIALGEALKKNTSLVYMNLSLTDLKNEGALALAQGLEINKTLKYLNLTGNKGIGLKGVRALTESLKVNNSLIALELADLQINTISIELMAEVLKINRSLTSLDLSGNIISSIAIKALLDALEVNPLLVSLKIGSDRYIEYIEYEDLLKTIKSNPFLSIELKLLPQTDYLGDKAVIDIKEALAENKACKELYEEIKTGKLGFIGREEIVNFIQDIEEKIKDSGKEIKQHFRKITEEMKTILNLSGKPDRKFADMVTEAQPRPPLTRG